VAAVQDRAGARAAEVQVVEEAEGAVAEVAAEVVEAVNDDRSGVPP
jgi:hypothetical protein